MNKYSSKFCWKRATEDEVKEHIKIVINDNIKWNGECLEWIGYKDKDGYGRMRFWKKRVHSTRMVWYLEKNEMPDGKVICHKCDNPKCVNFEHLFIGTVSDNTVDAFKKGRRSAKKGEESHFAKLRESQVIEIKKMLKQKISHSKIGIIFGVHGETIGDIARNRNWKHVNPGENYV